MTLKNLTKAPFPYFGGKTGAAPAVWAALGDVQHYVEPFAGSLAVLLLRPHPCNRTYYSETINDIDGLICNVWRSIQMSPEATANYASWPVCEADLHARHLALVHWREDTPLERLMGDPTYHDPAMAGFWIWGACCWIGGGWCTGKGPWTINDDGIFIKQGRAPKGTREPGVSRRLLHVSNDGQGINRPQAREPGVSRQRPHIGDNGMGINHAGAREPGVACEREFHSMTMPEVRRWIDFLSARIRHVRVLNGDWVRACTKGATHMLSVRASLGTCGVFLDPPYGGDVRDKGLYASDDYDVAQAVQAWCIANGTNPKLRIVLAGFDTEHEVLEREHGWRCVEWFTSGWLKGGMGNIARNNKRSAKRDRLWLSPHCLDTEETPCK